LRLARDRRWQTVLAVAPDSDARATFWSRAAGRIKRLPQRRGDLGERIQRLFRRLPPGPVLIVGGDIPGLTAGEIAKAFRLLGNADAVLGPAMDGGYWLVGLRRSPKLLAPFAGVRWSSPHALADTVANLDGKRIDFAALLGDVDTAEDYRRLRAAWQRLLPPKR
jgi:glycosyltransferase A (GT-A) superfamily protein (DUF2064 family)